jgi:predicted AlkP superfamily phosphohydrolase/phosphomutase
MLKNTIISENENKVSIIYIAKEMGRACREDLPRHFFLSLDIVEWSLSRDHSMGNFGQQFSNLKESEPQGIISPGSEYDEMMDEITQRLKNLVDPETGQPVIERIFRREKVYEGTYADRAPTILYLMG